MTTDFLSTAEAGAQTSLADLMRRFGDDFNAARIDLLPGHYTAGFTAIVDGGFVSRTDYLARTDMLVAAGAHGIGFDLRDVVGLADDVILAAGTVCVSDANDQLHRSLFSIVCLREGGTLKFAHTHSSTAPSA